MDNNQTQPTEALNQVTQEGKQGAQPQAQAEGQQTPETIPYERFKEVNDQKKQLEQQAQQYKQLAQQYYYTALQAQQLQQEEQQQQQQQVPQVNFDDPREFWSGAEQNPREWAKAKLAPVMQELLSDYVQGTTTNLLQQYVEQQQTQQLVESETARVAQQYEYFNNPIAQQQLLATVEYLNQVMPPHYTATQLFDLAAQQTLQAYGLDKKQQQANQTQQLGESAGQYTGNMVPNTNEAELKKRKAVESRDANALAALALQSLKNKQ